MTFFKKENLPVIVALSLPVLLILLVGGISFIAGRNVRSSHNFAYSLTESVSWVSRDCFTYKSYYGIDASGHLELYPYETSALDGNSMRVDPCLNSNQKRVADAPQLYVYDSKADTTKPVTFDEASALQFASKSQVSPDGYTVDYRSGGGGIMDIFGSYDRDSGIYINKRNQHRKLPGIDINGSDYYGEDFNFIGWIN